MLRLKSRHRIMCGDSTDENDVAKLMAGEKADMVYTDPPYGMNLDTDYSSMPGGKKHKKVEGDHNNFDAKTILHQFSYCQEIFLFGADYYAHSIPQNSGSWVVWDKCREKGIDSDWSGKFGSEFELCWSKNKNKRIICQKLAANGYFAVKDEKKVHPTQKPVKLAEWFFDKWGKDKNLIVDLFLGSGSTLIACEKTGRRLFGMELDEHYMSVIIKRWEDYTGKTAVRLAHA